MTDEDYGDDDFADDEDYEAAYEKAKSSGDDEAAAKIQARIRGRAARHAAAAKKTTADSAAASGARGRRGSASLPPAFAAAAPAAQRARSRPRLGGFKGATPSVPNAGMPRSSSELALLPALGAGSSAITSTVEIDSSELLASEQLSVAVSAEMQAAEHLRRVRARVQRELRKSSSMSALQGVRNKKLAAANAMRQDMNQRIGKDLTAAIMSDDVPRATDEEVRKFSELLNKQLERFHPDARNFFVLFKHIDVDGSRRISYRELSQLIREELRLKKSELPEVKLHALWKVLDENASGFVDAGELSRFMRIGRPAAGLGNRVRMVIEKKAANQQQLSELARKSGKHLTRDLVSKEVPRAEEDEVRELSHRFNSQLAVLRPRDATNGNNWYRLFKHMDVDGSGRISFKEFHHMVRHELCLLKADLPLPQLQGLWRALDGDDSGFICAGEFGRFMRISAEAAPLDPVTQARERQREEEATRRQRQSALWKANAARKAQGNASRLAKEAMALEAALFAAQQGLGGGVDSSLPPLNGQTNSSLINGSIGNADALRGALARTTNAPAQRHF